MVGIPYVRCGPVDGWRHLFNVLDVLSGWRMACRFNTPVAAEIDAESPAGAAAAGPDISRVALQCDSGLQCAGKMFGRKAAFRLGIGLKFIRIRTSRAERARRVISQCRVARVRLAPRLLQPAAGEAVIISGAFQDRSRSRLLHSVPECGPPDEFVASWEADHR